jgi:hypothetical protein
VTQMHRFLLVSFSFGNRLKIEELEHVFTAIGDDWIRFSPLTWIIWTNKPAAHIYTLLNGYLEFGDHTIITAFPEMKGEMFGFLPNWVWNWLNSKSPTPQFNLAEKVSDFIPLPPPKS